MKFSLIVLDREIQIRSPVINIPGTAYIGFNWDGPSTIQYLTSGDTIGISASPMDPGKIFVVTILQKRLNPDELVFFCYCEHLTYLDMLTVFQETGQDGELVPRPLS